MTKSTSGTPRPQRLSWSDPGVRSIVYQVVALCAVGGVVWFLVHNTLHNLAVRNIASGFGFLSREAGFAIGESMISYTPADTYGRALTVGILNTLRTAVFGIVFATIFGTIIGIARLSKNWLVSRLARVYVEVMRNTPLLIQMYLIYFGLPLFGIFLSGFLCGVIAIALQHGAKIETLRSAMKRNPNGAAASPLGRLLDLIAEEPF